MMGRGIPWGVSLPDLGMIAPALSLWIWGGRDGMEVSPGSHQAAPDGRGIWWAYSALIKNR